MTNNYLVCFLLTFLVPLATCSDNGGDTRDEKLISTFQVVRFPNDGCVGSNSRNGTCYTSQECSSKGGTSAGSCADGFGVCCTFVISTCGSSSSENLTVWTQPTTVDSGVCTLNVMPLSDDICSLRLDFTTFVISGPSTWTLVQGRRRLGHGTQANLDTGYVLEGVNWATNCFTDAFYAQGASPSSNPPVICGTNSGHHMYVEADVDRGNKLMFALSDVATVVGSITRGYTSLATRVWDMTISHIECASMTLPPTGCTKYYWNAAGVATLQNYNYVTTDSLASIHLAQQHERMCIRKERGKCVGCFFAAAGAFDVSHGNEALNIHQTAAGGCCGYYSTVGLDHAAANVALNGYFSATAASGGQVGWDCVIIPGAFTGVSSTAGAVQETQTAALLQQAFGVTGTHMNVPQGPQICGSAGGIGPGVAIMTVMAYDEDNGTALMLGEATALSVCTRHVPFTLEFMSDDLEGLGNTAIDNEFGDATQIRNQGFSISHSQLDC